MQRVKEGKQTYIEEKECREEDRKEKEKMAEMRQIKVWSHIPDPKEAVVEEGEMENVMLICSEERTEKGGNIT